MKFLLVAAALAVALTGCAQSLEAAAQIPEPARMHASSHAVEYLDLTDDFAAFWEANRTLEPAPRAAAFKAFFQPLARGFYSREKAGPRSYDDLINRALDQFPDTRNGIEAVSARFRTMAEPARTSFEAEFGPMGAMPPIILLHSLGEFDGGVRSLEAQRTLLFGADMIAKIHSAHGVQPFFHHELFHVFHERSFSNCGAVWCGLWNEGLAVYVADKLNPGATDAQLLLTTPVPLRAAVESNRQAALCTVLARLDSNADDDRDGLFSSGQISAALPSRSGYYVGYLIATEAGRTRDLKTLAGLSGEQVRPLVEESLRALIGTNCAQGERG